MAKADKRKPKYTLPTIWPGGSRPEDLLNDVLPAIAAARKLLAYQPVPNERDYTPESAESALAEYDARKSAILAVLDALEAHARHARNAVRKVRLKK